MYNRVHVEEVVYAFAFPVGHSVIAPLVIAIIELFCGSYAHTYMPVEILQCLS